MMTDFDIVVVVVVVVDVDFVEADFAIDAGVDFDDVVVVQ